MSKKKKAATEKKVATMYQEYAKCKRAYQRALKNNNQRLADRHLLEMARIKVHWNSIPGGVPDLPLLFDKATEKAIREAGKRLVHGGGLDSIYLMRKLHIENIGEDGPYHKVFGLDSGTKPKLNKSEPFSEKTMEKIKAELSPDEFTAFSTFMEILCKPKGVHSVVVKDADMPKADGNKPEMKKSRKKEDDIAAMVKSVFDDPFNVSPEVAASKKTLVALATALATMRGRKKSTEELRRTKYSLDSFSVKDLPPKLTVIIPNPTMVANVDGSVNLPPLNTIHHLTEVSDMVMVLMNTPQIRVAIGRFLRQNNHPLVHIFEECVGSKMKQYSAFNVICWWPMNQLVRAMMTNDIGHTYNLGNAVDQTTSEILEKHQAKKAKPK